MRQDINYKVHLEGLYKEALARLHEQGRPTAILSPEEIELLDEVLKYAESAKGVLTVLITSLFYKLTNSDQDVRFHQQSLKDGYSGRTFDTQFITPFLKSKNFPAMAESGWLTRSLEQNSPYELDYRGKITPVSLKTAFLDLLDRIQKGSNSKEYLLYILQSLILLRDVQAIKLAKPTNITIDKIIEYLNNHFNATYSSSGGARLPVLALYSAYECFVRELLRFAGKQLLPLESHTAADSRSGRIGDIEILDDKGKSFEGIEVKHGIEITSQMVKDAFAKFRSNPVSRYYIFSTSGVKQDEIEEIRQEINRIESAHGCQVIVGGVLNALRCYLRLLNDPADFIEKYAINLEQDKALKFEHKEKWNEIVSEES